MPTWTQLADALRKPSDEQMAQKLATRKPARREHRFPERTHGETLNQRVSTRQQAIDLNVGTKINLYDAKQELEKSEASLASDQRQLIVNDAALEEIESEKVKTVSQFIADNEKQVRRRVAQDGRGATGARQGFIPARPHQALCAHRRRCSTDGRHHRPRPGRHDRAATCRRHAARAGTLQVEALVPNLDIGFCRNSARRRRSRSHAFPFTRFGVLSGKRW